MKQRIRIGSRGSDLALWQAHFAKAALEKLGAEVEIKIIKTQGDKIQHLSFDKMEGKGFFTKEIEAALLDNEIDLAVHSHKDLETDEPEGLTVAAVSYRENPTDTLLINKDVVDASQTFKLKESAVVGTSSARRKNQIRFFRPDVELKDLRGNVPTRINKLREGQYDAILLASAGIKRLKLDLSEFHALELPPQEFVPAPAQGVLGFQIRTNDQETRQFVKQLNDADVNTCISVERGILNLLNGGCQLPLGAYCIYEDDTYKLWVSQSETWQSLPTRLYRDTSPKELIKTVLDDLKKKVV